MLLRVVTSNVYHRVPGPRRRRKHGQKHGHVTAPRPRDKPAASAWKAVIAIVAYALLSVRARAFWLRVRQGLTILTDALKEAAFRHDERR